MALEPFDLVLNGAYYGLFISACAALGVLILMLTRILMPTQKQITLSAIIVLTLAVGVFAQKKDDKKQTDEQKRDIQAVVKLVDDMAAGQPAPNDFNVTWAHEDFL